MINMSLPFYSKQNENINPPEELRVNLHVAATLGSAQLIETQQHRLLPLTVYVYK